MRGARDRRDGTPTVGKWIEAQRRKIRERGLPKRSELDANLRSGDLGERQ